VEAGSGFRNRESAVYGRNAPPLPDDAAEDPDVVVDCAAVEVDVSVAGSVPVLGAVVGDAPVAGDFVVCWVSLRCFAAHDFDQRAVESWSPPAASWLDVDGVPARTAMVRTRSATSPTRDRRAPRPDCRRFGAA
jgi:hypothetical protein